MAAARIDNMDYHRQSEFSQASAGHGFSLASFMLFVTMSCVVLGMTVASPLFGFLLAVLALITWARTAAVGRHRAAINQPVSVAGNVCLYGRSLVVSSVVATLFLSGLAIGLTAYFNTVIDATDLIVRPDNARNVADLAESLSGNVLLLIVGCLMIWGAHVFNQRAWKHDVETRR